MEEIFLLLLLLALPFPGYPLRARYDLAGEGGFDFLAHLLADYSEGLNDDLQVLSGEEVVDDDVLGQLLIVVLGLEYLHDQLQGVDVVVFGQHTGVGGADVAFGRLQGHVYL